MACRSFPPCESRKVKSGLILSNKGAAREGDGLDRQVEGRGKWVSDLSWALICWGPWKKRRWRWAPTAFPPPCLFSKAARFLAQCRVHFKQNIRLANPLTSPQGSHSPRGSLTNDHVTYYAFKKVPYISESQYSPLCQFLSTGFFLSYLYFHLVES